MSIIADTPEKIELYRMLVLEKMLRLEIHGVRMTKYGQPTAYSAIKEEYNLKGSKQRVWDTFKLMIETIKQEQKGEA